MNVNTILNVFTLIDWRGNKKNGDAGIAGEVRAVTLSLK